MFSASEELFWAICKNISRPPPDSTRAAGMVPFDPKQLSLDDQKTAIGLAAANVHYEIGPLHIMLNPRL